MKAAVVIIGVMLFPWSTAAVATGLSFLVTGGRLGKREWHRVLFALAIIGAPLPPSESEITPPSP